MLGKWFDRLSSHVTVWTWLFSGGVVSTATASALIAKATGWLAPWGPIGWWTCALGGVLISSTIFFLLAKGHEIYTMSSLRKKMRRPSDHINPLDDVFENKRINLADFALPLDPIIRGKTFRNCDILGPCNVCILSNTDFSHNTGAAMQAVLVRRGEDNIILNAVGLEHCSVRNCRVFQLTFFINEDNYAQFAAGMKGLNWVTYTPTSY